MGKSRQKTVDGYLARLPKPQQEIAEQLRKLIRTAAPDLQETVKWGYPCYVGDGNVCSIMAFKNHVNLAFFQGAELPDPDGLLEGTGKGMRHLKLHTAADIRRRAISALVRQAARLHFSQ